MKKLSILLVLVLALSMAVPVFAAPTVGGDLLLSVTEEKGQPTDFDARLRLKVSGSVSDEVAYAVRLKAAEVDTTDLEGFKGSAVSVDYAYLTFSPKEIPAKVEAGLLNFTTTPLAIYDGETFSGSRAGVRVIPTLPNGFSAWGLVVPDTDKNTDDNDVLYAGSLGQSGSFGSVSGILWKESNADDLGWVVQGSLNVTKDALELYGEYGKDVTGEEHKVVGAYLPIVSKAAGFDPYIEYDVENGALGVYIEKTFANNLTFGFTAMQDPGDKHVVLSPAIWISF